jgi:hypothetical protein
LCFHLKIPYRPSGHPAVLGTVTGLIF